MRTYIYLLFGLLFFVTSCTMPSLHSIVDENHRVLDDRIIGDWLSIQEDEIEYSIDISTDGNENIDSFKTSILSYLDSIGETINGTIWHVDRAADITWYFKDSENHGIRKLSVYGVRKSLDAQIQKFLYELHSYNNDLKIDSCLLYTSDAADE